MTTTSTQAAEGFLTLLSLRDVGTVTAVKLAETFPTIEAACAAAPERFKKVASSRIAERFAGDPQWLAAGRAEAARILDDVARIEAGITIPYESAYPERLASCHDRPNMLTWYGDLPTGGTIAFYGSRFTTQAGAGVAARIASRFAEDGWGAAVGLEGGISDIVAKQFAAVERPVVAVTGAGLANLSNYGRDMALRIFDANGTIASEQDPVAEEDSSRWIRTRRIISGMSEALVVLQANMRPEFYHAVRYAMLQGRRVIAPALPEKHAREPESEGTVALTTLTGPQFAAAVGADGPFLELLETEFGDRTVAEPITGRDDFEPLWASLRADSEQRLADALALVQNSFSPST